MNKIEQMLTGKIEMAEFLDALKKDEKLQEQISNLVPVDARNSPSHEIWKRISYDTCKRYNFDYLLKIKKMFRMDNSIADNLNIFGTIRTVYRYLHPTIQYTRFYDDAFDLYLKAIQDCFDGKEVEAMVEEIVQTALLEKTKKERIIKAKAGVAEKFHVHDRKRPRWTQGPEWPMGALTPMAFVSQKRYGECVKYTFEDIDTHEIRIVEQYY